MKERRKKLTAAELRAAGVSRDLVVRRIPAPDKADAPGPSESRAVRTGATDAGDKQWSR
jgi:hypothetical protein